MIVTKSFSGTMTKWAVEGSSEKLFLQIRYLLSASCRDCFFGQHCSQCIPGYSLNWYEGSKHIRGGDVFLLDRAKNSPTQIERVFGVLNLTAPEFQVSFSKILNTKEEYQRVISETKALMHASGLKKYDPYSARDRKMLLFFYLGLGCDYPILEAVSLSMRPRYTVDVKLC